MKRSQMKVRPLTVPTQSARPTQSLGYPELDGDLDEVPSCHRSATLWIFLTVSVRTLPASALAWP